MTPQQATLPDASTAHTDDARAASVVTGWPVNPWTSPGSISRIFTGLDTDDKYVGFGVTYPARLDSATDLDAFIADLLPGVYALTFTPTDVPSQIDLAVDIYDGGGSKIATLNAGGVGLAEGGNYTVTAAGRSVFVVRAVNALQGNYSLRFDKKP